jgi:hypothetical protein
MKELWYHDGVQVWDEHKHEYFGLKAILFFTASDSPAARNLSEQSKKVGSDVHIVSEKETHSIWASHNKQCTWDIDATFQWNTSFGVWRINSMVTLRKASSTASHRSWSLWNG